jgi:uncharacterized small protein (DUF1192 family)
MSQSGAQDKKEQRLRLLDDEIGRHLAESERSGELRSAPSYGRPLDFGDGYERTPAEFRMPMKVLKDAGVVPPEVEAMREIAALQAELDALVAGGAGCAGDAGGAGGAEGEGGSDAAVRALRQRLAEKRQALALRLEKLRTSGSL